MNFDSLLSSALNLVHQYSILAVVIALILLVIAYKNQKAAFKFVFFLLIVAAFFYTLGLFSDVFTSGSKNKDQMINKTRKLIDQ